MLAAPPRQVSDGVGPQHGRDALRFLTLATLGANADAQGLTGSLFGTVRDADGGILSGVTVRVSSPALPENEQRAATNSRGQWRFPVLPPGQYQLIVEGTSRFEVHREVVQVGAGSVIDRTVVLKVKGMTESITVAASSEGSARTSGIETRFDNEFIRTIPTNRYSMFALINSAPGVSPTSPSSGSINTVSVFGSAVNENTFLIDGTNFTCPCQGVSRAEPILDVIQEMHVQSMGASVEFGNLQGAVFNVVTRQGGARFEVDASFYAQPASLTAQPIVLAVTKGTQPSSGYERARYRDFTASLGGPLKRDRLWFFAAYQYLRDYDSQPGVDPAFPRRYEQNKVFGKLNWRFSPSLQMMQSFHQENWVNPTAPTLSAPFVTTLRPHASVPNMTFGHLTHVLSDRTVWDVRAGRFLLRADTDPSSGDRTTPSRTDLITGLVSGNAAQMTTLFLDRVTAKAVLNRHQPDWLGTDHELKIGVQIERGAHRLLQAIPGGVRYNDSNGGPLQAIFRDPAVAGGVFITPSVFVADSVRVTGRMTIDAGVRFDHARAINPDLPAVSPDGRETDDRLRGVGTLYVENMISPRLGAVMRLDKTGRMRLRTSYGRFYQGVLTGELDPISQGATKTTTMAYDTGAGGYTTLVSVVDPKRNISIDPNTRSPRTDEFSLAFDRDVTAVVRASAAYIRKRGSDFIGWIDTGGQYRAETRTLADGTVVPVAVLTNATSDRRFLLTNPDNLFVEYDGMVLAIEKRHARGWQASGSYTYSRARGMQIMSNGAADDPQFSTIARPAFLTFGQDPNDWTNAEGRLPNDRPHVFRATGTVRLPWQQLSVSGHLQTFSGKPWAATAQVTLPQGARKILLEQRGTRRLSSQSLFNLRVARTVRFGPATTADLMLDVLNVLNDTAEEAVVSDTRSATTFGRPSKYIDPRRVMLGVRFNFGR